jgi:DNA polymerase III alpha subunit (gram-positive type)
MPRNIFYFLCARLDRVLNRLTLAVCPRKPIPAHVEDLTGLSNYNLEHQATWGGGVGVAVAAFLAALARPVVLVAHNGMRFDFPLLKRELEAAR